MITNKEFKQRWLKLQNKMAEKNIDILFVYSNDQAVFGPGNVRYLSNFYTHFEHAAVIMPVEGEPILAVGPETKEFADLDSHISDIRVISEFAIPDEDYPYTEMTSLKSIMSELAKNSSRPMTNVGIVGFDLLPVSLYRRLEGCFKPNLEITDAGEILVELRAVKSRREIEIIEKGYQIADKAMEACVNAVAPGRTELEIAAAGEAVMREMGAEGVAIDTIVAAGRDRTYPIVVRPTENEVAEGDLVLITIGPRYKGYNPAIGRPVLVGDVSDELITAMEWALKAQRAVEAELKPGAPGSIVEGKGREVLKEAGLEKYFVYAGVHSVGMAEFEPPILSPKSTTRVEENMVFSIDIPLFLTPWGGFRFEDGFEVTSDSCRRINNFPREIIRK